MLFRAKQNRRGLPPFKPATVGNCDLFKDQSCFEKKNILSAEYTESYKPSLSVRSKPLTAITHGGLCLCIPTVSYSIGSPATSLTKACSKGPSLETLFQRLPGRVHEASWRSPMSSLHSLGLNVHSYHFIHIQ